MTVSEEVVRQEVSDLHRFIEPMVRMCSELRDDHPVYSGPSREFFDHIEKLGNETLAYLRTFPEEVMRDPRTASSKRQRLLTLRAAWEGLHEYLRPALDADSLHLPTPLITALHDKLHEAEEWSSYHFALFHSVEANYLELPPGLVRSAAEKIAGLIRGTQFPPCLGLVGIPYSQADGFFLNCILAHEMAHFVYQEDASHDIDEEVDSVLEILETEVGELQDDEITFCRELIASWAEEIFCDLFAICQIGPAFSFAFSQLVAASMLIGRKRGEPADFYSFTQSHPALASRFRSHRILLEKLGWWKEIRKWSSAPVQVLKQCKLQTPLFTVELEQQLPAEVSQDRLLQSYDEMCTWLIDYVQTRIKAPVEDVSAFHDQSPIIAQYLRRAIVPSTIMSKGNIVHPNPVLLMNAGFQFLSEGLPGLLSSIEGKDPNSIESRSWVTARLELWLLKALEDHRLLTRQEP